MLENPRARRRLFFGSASFTALTLVFLLVRTLRKPDWVLPTAAFLVALIGLGILVVFEIRAGRRHR